jgi:hypothetical protein
MGPGALASFLNLIVLGLVDWIAVNVFLKSAIRQAQGEKRKAQA